MKKIFVIAVIAYSLLMVSAVPAYAQVTLDPTLRPENLPTISGGAENRDEAKVNYKEDAVRASLVFRFGSIILGLAGVVAIYFILNNAWFIIASAGNEETVTTHKKGLMWAVIGLILLMLSYSIMRFVISIPFQADQGPSSPAATTAPSAAAPSVPAAPGATASPAAGGPV